MGRKKSAAKMAEQKAAAAAAQTTTIPEPEPATTESLPVTPLPYVEALEELPAPTTTVPGPAVADVANPIDEPVPASTPQDEPVAEEPAVEELTVEEPAVEEPAVEQSSTSISTAPTEVPSTIGEPAPVEEPVPAPVAEPEPETSPEQPSPAANTIEESVPAEDSTPAQIPEPESIPDQPSASADTIEESVPAPAPEPESTPQESTPASSEPKEAPTYAEATAKPAPPSSPSPSSRVSTLQKLRILLLRTLCRLSRTTDRTLLRLSTLLSTPRGIDVLLCTLSYTLQLLSGLASHYLDHKLTAIAEKLMEKADPLLLPGESLTATFPAPKKFEWLAKFMTSAKTLNGVIADYRIFVRLWGLVGLYTWTRGTLQAPLPSTATRKDKILRGVTWGEIASLVAFQVLENGAYLSSKGVLTSDAWAGDEGKRRETKWWVWSCRFWCAYVVLEGVRLGTEAYYAKQGKRVEDGEKEGKIAREKENRLWWRDVVSNIGYFPMTLHWSVEEGILSPVAVGVCGMIAGGSNLLDAWRATV